MIQEFLSGLIYVPKGILIILRPGFHRFIILPILISVVLFGSGLGLSTYGLHSLIEQLLPNGDQWLFWLIGPLLIIVLIVGMVYSFSIVANLISLPFSAFLAEQMEMRKREAPVLPGENLKTLLNNTMVGWKTQITCLIYQIIRMLPLLVVSFIPMLNILTTWVLFAFSAWMLALTYMSTPMGNHGLPFSEILKTCKAQKGLMLGLGTGLMLLALIPFLNLLIVPAGTAAATLVWIEKIPLSTELSKH